MRTRAANPPRAMPAIAHACSATSTPSRTDSGARRRSVGGRIAGAGRDAAFAALSTFPQSTAAAAFQSGHSGDQTPMPATAISIAALMRVAGDECEAAVVAAEAERIRQRDAHVALRRCRSMICGPHAASGTRRIERARHEAALDRDQRDHRFDDAGRAERVAGPALGGTRDASSPETCARRAPLRLRRSACSRCRAG